MENQEELLKVLQDLMTIGLYEPHPVNDLELEKAEENLKERINDIEYLSDEVKHELHRMSEGMTVINLRWRSNLRRKSNEY